MHEDGSFDDYLSDCESDYSESELSTDVGT